MKRLVFLFLLFPALCLAGSHSVQVVSVGSSGDAVTITKVTAYFTAKGASATQDARLELHDGTAAYGDVEALTTSYVEYSHEFTTDPSSASWSETTVNAILGGINPRNITDTIYVTQFYLIVTYSDTSTETLRPTSDSYNNNWTTSNGAAHYAEVDETSADGDTTHIYTSTDYTSCRFGMGDLP